MRGRDPVLQTSLMPDTKTKRESSHCRFTIWYHIFPRMPLTDVSYECTHEFLRELAVAHSSTCATLFCSCSCHGWGNPSIQISLARDKPWPQRLPCCLPSYDLLHHVLSACTSIEILFQNIFHIRFKIKMIINSSYF